MRVRLIIGFYLGLSFSVFGQQEFQRKFQRLFIETPNDSVIRLPKGKFILEGSLWLDGKKNVIIRGAGKNETILDFSGQVSGAEGIKITDSEHITVEDLTVQNTKGDGIKTQLVNGITFRNVKTAWTNGPDKKNGGYGLYPVQCTNVLIDHCTAMAASDAGIYVGQSKFIVVKNSTAFENVAGIEIENSLYADVYDNDVYNNTGGILVFDLPDLIQKKGGFVRVFNNRIHDNNHRNFAPRGNIVGKVPPGTGLMILATNHVEAFDNRIINNITAGTAIISYHMTENPINDSTYDAYPSNIYVHNNYYERPRVRATGKGRLGKLYRFKLRFGKDVPHIIYDGIRDKERPERKICIRDNENATFANLDAAGGFKNVSRDISAHDCEQARLDPVILPVMFQQ
jgi:parallel beta-helix repeat protein